MKKTIKTAMFAFAVVATGFGGMKAYDAYQIKGNCLMMENIEALSNSGEGNGTSHGAYQHMDYVDCGSGTKLQLYCDDRSCPDRCKYDCGVHV